MRRRNDSPHAHRSTAFFRPQPNGDLRCPGCAREGAVCLRWDEDHAIHRYRPRPLNAGEYTIIVWVPALKGPAQIIVKPAEIHGISGEYVLAEQTVCGAGYLIITGAMPNVLRSYGSCAIGRDHSCKRRGWRRSQSDRRSPTILKFRVSTLYDNLYRNIEPIPKNSHEFVKLLAIFARRLRSGDGFDALLRAYGDELREYLDLDDASGAGGTEQ